MDELKIENKECTFIFEINDKNWCALSAETKEKEVYLGADDVNVLCRKMLENLSDIHNNKAFIYDGKEMHSIICLYETYNTLMYHTCDDDSIQLMIGDKDGTISPLASLTEKERIGFINKIELFLSEYNKKHCIEK